VNSEVAAHRVEHFANRSVVGDTGLEPVLLSELDLKSSEAANFSNPPNENPHSL
jgi:hypothetical protein